MYTLMLLVSSAALALSMPARPFNVRAVSNSSLTASSAPKLPGILLINGEPAYLDGEPVVSLQATAASSSEGPLCNVTTDDVYTCAVNKRDRILNPENMSRTGMAGTLGGGINGDFLSVEYNSDYTECVVSAPQIIARDTLKMCQIDTCSETFAWSETVTDTHSYGFKITANQKANFEVPGIAKVEVSLGEEFSDSWTDSKATTNSRTTVRTMRDGDVCAWTSIQFFVDCKSKVTITKLAMYTADGQRKYTGMDNICTYFPNSDDRELFIRGQGFQESTVKQVTDMCNSAETNTDENGRVRIDLGDGSLTAYPWSIQGCMFD